jgi:hypothetical protein
LRDDAQFTCFEIHSFVDVVRRSARRNISATAEGCSAPFGDVSLQ